VRRPSQLSPVAAEPDAVRPRAAVTSLDELTSAAAARLGASGAVLAVPVGSTEQHGPHLPLGTDLFIARELARGLSCRDGGPTVVRAPELGYGSSGEHQDFPGTVSIGRDAVYALLLEFGRSAAITFPRILFLSTHGGNAEPVTAAVERLRYEGRDVRAWAPNWGRLTERRPDAHAGWLAIPGTTVAASELIEAMQTGGVRAVSESGVLGDPTGADAETGRRLLDAATEAGARLLARWPPLSSSPEGAVSTEGAAL
jgi:creatinine amidohydrolase/Fe(II)-dependent formamide hydrolase-like protein